MSSRRPADQAAAGQPDPKRAKVDGGASSTAAAPPMGFDIASIKAQLATKKAEAEARIAAQKSAAPTKAVSSAVSTASKAAGPAALPPKPVADQSMVDKLAEAKRRIEALNAKMQNPYSSGSGAALGGAAGSRAGASAGSSASASGQASAKTVTSIALHPLLMGDQGGQAGAAGEKNEKKALRDRYRTMAPKFSTTRANQSLVQAAQAVSSSRTPATASAPVLNPYTSAATPAAGPSAGGEAGEDAAAAKARRSKKMTFSQPGKYIRQGDALRNEAKMEALRQRIAEASKKAGLDSEFDTLERSLKRQPPPDVEWWDKALLPEGGRYDDIDKAMETIIKSDDSLITHLIQHPIPIPAPQDKKLPDQGLRLTKKEQKKLRRQRRKAELEDKRDRQKMGLIPPDPPKVRLANLMKVLTSDAVQDPTKVEAKVRREVTARAEKHEMDNKERQLTAEQRKEKEWQQHLARERKGLFGAVYKIKYLTNGKHKFKVKQTAKDDSLTGVCIFHRDFALVLVEGDNKAIKHYRRLMLNRIDWTEKARPLGANGEEIDEDDAADGAGAAATGRGADEDEGPDSLEDNKCECIWEGEIPEKTFHFFKAKHAESDSKAKEFLTTKWEGMWDLAKRWVWSGEDL